MITPRVTRLHTQEYAVSRWWFALIPAFWYDIRWLFWANLCSVLYHRAAYHKLLIFCICLLCEFYFYKFKIYYQLSRLNNKHIISFYQITFISLPNRWLCSFEQFFIPVNSINQFKWKGRRCIKFKIWIRHLEQLRSGYENFGRVPNQKN